MNEPWKKYQQPAAKPWEKYAAPPESQTPEEPQPKPNASWGDVLKDIPRQALIGVGEPMVNAPSNIGNLLTAGVGYGLHKAGLIDQPPEPPFPTMSLNKWQPPPENMTGGQKLTTAIGTGALTAPLGGPLRQAAQNATLGGVSGLAAEGTTQATDNPYLGLAAGIATPFGAQKGAQRLSAGGQNESQLNQLRDTATRQSQDLGLAIPAADTNPTTFNRLTQMFSGSGPQNKVQRLNAPASRNAAAQDLGIEAKDVTPKGLQAIKDSAGKIYDEVALVPQISRTSQVSGQYGVALKELGATNKAMADVFPGLESSQVDKVVNALSSGKPFSGKEAIQALKIMRDRAATYAKQHANADNGDPDAQRIAKAYSGGAKALEQLMDAEFQRQGLGDLMKRFQGARKTFAQAESVIDAMDAKGNVDPIRLRKMSEAGIPLSGNMEKLANVAGVYPGSVKLPKNASESASKISTGDLFKSVLQAVPSAVVGSAPYRHLRGGVPWYENLMVKALRDTNPYGVAGVTAPLNSQALVEALRQQQGN